MNNKKTFIGVALLWIVLIGGFIGFKEFTVRTGEDILLKTRPIDPRDLFRGDYVILDYEISEIQLDKGYDDLFRAGEKVYVLLDVDESRVGTFSSIQKNKPLTNEQLFITGIIRNDSRSLIRNSDNIINIEYGIESYFVPEGRGFEIERNLGEIYTKIKLDKNGRAVIQSLVLEGERIEF